MCLKTLIHILRCQACLQLALGLLLVLNSCDSCATQIRQHLSSHGASVSHIFSSWSLVFWDLNQYQINQTSTQCSEKHIAFHSRLSPQIPFWDITSVSQEHILLEKMGQKADLELVGSFCSCQGEFGGPDSIWNSGIYR